MPPELSDPAALAYEEATSALAARLESTAFVEVRQHAGSWRWISGIETRTRYVVADDAGRTLGWAAEQGAGLRTYAALQHGRLWRPFDVELFDDAHRLAFRAVHPARWVLARLDVDGGDGLSLGAIQQRVSVPRKRFDVLDAAGETVMTASFSALRRFEFVRSERVVASVEYRSSVRAGGGNGAGPATGSIPGAGRRLGVGFERPLNGTERLLVLATALFVDLKYLAHARSR